MLRFAKIQAAPVVLLALGLAACDGDTPTGPTEPRPPVTTPFQGAVTQNGASTHSFTSSTGGTITATLTSVGGAEGQVVGFALGNWFGNACSVVLANDAATSGVALTGSLTGATSLCVRVYDTGRIEGGAVPYTIEVVHP